MVIFTVGSMLVKCLCDCSILAFNQELLYSLYIRLSTWNERTCIGDLFLNRVSLYVQ